MFEPFENISVKIFGESHAPEIGVELSGVPAGEKIDLFELQSFTDRRKSTTAPWSTPRKEADQLIVESGISRGAATGDKIRITIKNNSVKSGDYSPLRFTPRPSHADYVAAVKDKTGECPSGGGRFSGRLTAALCAAGGIAKQLLERRGIEVLSFVRSIGKIDGGRGEGELTAEKIKSLSSPLKAFSNADKMIEVVMEAAERGDSVGGKAEVVVFGMEAGIGDAYFEGLEGRFAAAAFAVPAVKAVEFGLGTGFAQAYGSVANDPFIVKNGKIVTETNNSGGINGGISNGMPIVVSATFRPTPSISSPQKTVDLRTKEQVVISVRGRHDACIVPRGAVALEAAVALAALDLILN